MVCPVLQADLSNSGSCPASQDRNFLGQGRGGWVQTWRKSRDCGWFQKEGKGVGMPERSRSRSRTKSKTNFLSLQWCWGHLAGYSSCLMAAAEDAI